MTRVQLAGRLAFVLLSALLLVGCPGPTRPDEQITFPFPNEWDGTGFHQGTKTSGDRPVIVFVHGLGGGADTWFNAHTKAFWPRLLATDDEKAFEDADVFVYKYSADMFGKNQSIAGLADQLNFALRENGIHQRKRIIFVTHSLGGLVTRALLLRDRNYIDQTQMIYFFGTPTNGSSLADLLSMLPIGVSTFANQLKEMKNDDFLADMETAWINARFFRVPSYCAYESKSVAGVALVVPLRSAAALCTHSIQSIDEDHFGIVKPSGGAHKSYQALRQAYVETKAPAKPDLLQVLIAMVTDLTRKLDRLSGQQKQLLTAEGKLRREVAYIDLTKETYLQLQLFSGDRVRLLDQVEEGKSVCFADKDGQHRDCLTSSKPETTFLESGNGLRASALTIVSNGLTHARLQIEYDKHLDDMRYLAAPVPFVSDGAGTTPASKGAGTKAIPGTDGPVPVIPQEPFCQGIRRAGARVSCTELGDNKIWITHRTSFPSGKTESELIRDDIGGAANAIDKLGWHGDATIFGSASRSPFPCLKAARSISTFSDGEWPKESIGSRWERHILIKDLKKRTIFDEELECSDQAKTGTVNGNYILRVARAAWVGKHLESASNGKVVVKALSADERTAPLPRVLSDDQRVHVGIEMQVWR